MNYKLVIQFPLTNASADAFDNVLTIESQLELVIRDKHKVKGHEFGPNIINIVIHTGNPIDTFSLAKKTLPEKDLETITVAYSDIDNDEYTVIWPENYSGEFNPQ